MKSLDARSICIAHCFLVGLLLRMAQHARWNATTFCASCLCMAWKPLFWSVDQADDQQMNWNNKSETLLLLFLLTSPGKVSSLCFPGCKSVCKTLGPILANNQLDALFHVFIYFISLRVSSTTVLIIRRSNCINTSSGMISPCK